MQWIEACLKRHSKPICLGLLAAVVLVYGRMVVLWQREAALDSSAPSPLYTARSSSTPMPSLSRVYGTPAPSSDFPEEELIETGLLGGKYSWKFTQQEIITDHTYSRPGVSVSWGMYKDTSTYSDSITFFVADILVEDVTDIKTAFAKGTYQAGGVRAMETIAKANRCVVAISGDFSKWHDNGLIVRNGEVCRKQKISSDLCVLYRSGEMETYEAGTVTPDEILQMDPWQTWHFGPELLDDNGQPKTKFNTTVGRRNPRSVIGYYEPGHYCFVVVDGRQRRYSNGLNMADLSLLMYNLGCVRAYNLDGGATAHMSWQNEVINSPSKDRKVHDVICVCFAKET